MIGKREKSKNKIISLAVLFLFLTMVFLPMNHIIMADSSTDGSTVEIVLSTTADDIQISYQIPEYSVDTIFYAGHEYKHYSIPDEPHLNLLAFPDVPTIRRSIVIPDDKNMVVDVLYQDTTEYTNIDLIPSKGNFPRTIDPDDVPYKFDDIYQQDTWFPSSVVQLDEPYILRDFRGQIIQINPVQYNPAQHKIRVVQSIVISITEDGLDDTNVLQRTHDLTSIDGDFAGIYANHFLNYGNLISSFKYTPVSEQGNMLIICYDAFYNDMVPFVTWKNMKGVPTEMVNVSTIGDANAIKSYIANYYTTNGLTFVLLVGDVAQIPTYYLSGIASDPSYSYIVGSDHYMELFVGRFSAENSAQVQTQVERSIEYERDPQAGAAWYQKGVGIASNQGPGDDNEYDYQHIRNIRTLLLDFTYTSVDEFYDGSQGGADATGDPTPTMISTTLNEGRSIINYCGHGWMQGWGSSGFSNSNIATLTNDNMLPFITSVACNNGEFQSGTCFGEAWLRATHNNQPTGGIGAYMSTISQSWDPPMEAQDEFNNILVGMYTDNIKTSFGALCYNGAMAMMDDYGSGGTTEADAWTVFGDPSIQVRTDIPGAMSINHASSIMAGATEFEVTVTGVEGALCALSYNNVFLGAAYTDATGEAIITLSQTIPENADSLDFVVTAYNKIPYITTIAVASPGPVLMYDPVSYNAGIRAQGETIQTTFYIWNANVNLLQYSLSEPCEWIDVYPLSGESTGEHDSITVDIDTTGLPIGSQQCQIDITSNGGNQSFTVYVYIVDGNEILHIDQEIYDRGFPIRYAADGSWGGAQSYTPTISTLTRAELYLRKFGTPVYDLTVEVHQNSPTGPVLDTKVFTPSEIASTWTWFNIDFADISVTQGTSYCIVLRPPSNNPGNSFGYEWAYAFGNQYDDGTFWFTRNGGGLWRDLPTMYEFCFRMYGLV